jgi:replicative DNA helicase
MPANRVTSEILDRLPPCNLEAERGLIGSVLIDPQVLDRIKVRPEDFYADGNRRLFGHLQAIWSESRQLPLEVLHERLRRLGDLEWIGGMAYLAECAQKTVVSAHAGYYAGIISRKAQYREMIYAATEMLRDAYAEADEPESLLAAAEGALRSVKTGQYKTDPVSMEVATIDALALIDAVADRRYQAGVLTGFPSFDANIGGFFPGELVIIAARPGQGKTSLAMQIAYHAAEQRKRKVYVATLEMSRSELALRNLCRLSGVSNQKIRNGTLHEADREQLRHAALEQSQVSIVLHDWSTIRVYDIARAARSCGAEMVVVDYLTLLTPEDKRIKRYEQVGQLTRALKVMAKDLKIPVVVCAQLNRQSDTQGKETRPRMSQLRESGDIEQDADMVLLLYRPKDGLVRRSESGHDEERWDADLEVAKNRNGDTENFRLLWNKHRTSFAEFGVEENPAELF